MIRYDRRLSRGGFTLPEILVGVAMVGVLSAVVLPTVIGQMAKGETQRAVSDLQAVEQAAGLFRNDVGKWPASITHLVDATDLDQADLALDFTNNYPSTMQTVWQGPYLARGNVAGGGLPTAGGNIVLDIDNADWVETNDGTIDSADDTGQHNFVTFALTFTGDQTEADLRANNIDLAMDGTSGLSLSNATHGKIRYVTTSKTLFYLTSPAK